MSLLLDTERIVDYWIERARKGDQKAIASLDKYRTELRGHIATISKSSKRVAANISAEYEPILQKVDTLFGTPIAESKSTMKPVLLEYLIRACTRELLKQLNEGDEADAMSDQDQELQADKEESEQDRIAKAKKKRGGYRNSGLTKKQLNKDPFYRAGGGPINEDETIGAPAPPAAGQGTADQPPIPKNNAQTLDPAIPTPTTPLLPKVKPEKGINIINPQDKSKVDKVEITSKDDASIERLLYRKAASVAGPKVKVAISTMRAIKAAQSTPNVPLYLYIGQYDPQSEELFLMADHSREVANEFSVDPTSLTAAEPASYQATDFTSPDGYDPETMGTDYTVRQPGFTDRSRSEPEVDNPDIDENIRKIIKKMVSETLDLK